MTQVSETTLMTDLYSQEEVQQILQIAIARQANAGELTRVQLLEIADEMGISEADLNLAEQEWLVSRGEKQERHDFDAHRHHKFQRHFTRYLIINGFFIVLDVLGGGGLSWALYIALGWGLPLSLNAWKTYQLRGEDYEEAFQRWRRRRWLKKSFNTFLNQWLQPK